MVEDYAVVEDYRALADEIAADIAAGRLRPGDRLPPQRDYARRRGIAGSTAARVYAELTRRGLTVGEVGRGTFVRASARRPGTALAEPSGTRIDLELNHSVIPEQARLLADGIRPLLRPDVLEESMRPVGAAGTPHAREAVAGLLARAGWRPDPARVLFAGNGRQAIAAVIAALVPPGARLGVEELTYPVVKTIAARLGVTLAPLPVDEAGLVPEAVEAAARKACSARSTSSPRCTTPCRSPCRSGAAPSSRACSRGWTCPRSRTASGRSSGTSRSRWPQSRPSARSSSTASPNDSRPG